MVLDHCGNTCTSAAQPLTSSVLTGFLSPEQYLYLLLQTVAHLVHFDTVHVHKIRLKLF